MEPLALDLSRRGTMMDPRRSSSSGAGASFADLLQLAAPGATVGETPAESEPTPLVKAKPAAGQAGGLAEAAEAKPATVETITADPLALALSAAPQPVPPAFTAIAPAAGADGLAVADLSVGPQIPDPQAGGLGLPEPSMAAAALGAPAVGAGATQPSAHPAAAPGAMPMQPTAGAPAALGLAPSSLPQGLEPAAPMGQAAVPAGAAAAVSAAPAAGVNAQNQFATALQGTPAQPPANAAAPGTRVVVTTAGSRQGPANVTASLVAAQVQMAAQPATVQPEGAAPAAVTQPAAGTTPAATPLTQAAVPSPLAGGTAPAALQASAAAAETAGARQNGEAGTARQPAARTAGTGKPGTQQNLPHGNGAPALAQGGETVAANQAAKAASHNATAAFGAMIAAEKQAEPGSQAGAEKTLSSAASATAFAVTGASVSETGASSQPAAGKPLPAHPAPAEQVAAHVQKAVQTGADKITLHLTPLELGRIEVKLQLGEDGSVRAAVAVERVETLDLLQRDARNLERALQDAGVKADSGSLSFSLRDDQRQGQGRGFAGSDTPAETPRQRQSAAAELPAGGSTEYRRPHGDGALDIRV